MATVAGIRGAICVRENSETAILEATKELLEHVIRENDLTESMVAGVFFTSTIDLDATFPAASLRELGWRTVPALCAQELEVPDSMTRVIRIMVLANVTRSFKVKHQYLGKAAELRPDLAGESS